MGAIIGFFVRRHFLVHVIVAVAIVVGISSALGAQREGFPAVTLNQLVVTATLPGASAADVETKVTLPLEEAIAEVDGVDEYNSVVMDNVSVTTVEIYDDYSATEVREVQTDLRQAIDAINDFPDDMEDDPRVERVEPAKAPVIEIALSGSSDAVRRAADLLERELGRVDGVSEVSSVGVDDPEVRVLLDPVAARAHGVDLNDLVATISRRNVSGTGGTLESDRERKQVVMDARFHDPQDVASTPLRVNPDGGIVTIGDVARVQLTTVDSGLIVHTNGKPGVSVVVRKRADADILNTVDAVKAVVEDLELPEGVEAAYINDQSFVTRNRLALMASNGLIGIVLVIVVLGLFLTRKAALWVAVGVPVVLLGVLVLLQFAGLTLNLITLGGFVIVLGMLVDDAVVVAERIVFMQNRDDEPDPEVRGAMSVMLPVIASAITTSLAFTPMLALGGLPGKVAWALPVVVIMALVLSVVESFVILPAHMTQSARERARAKKRGGGEAPKRRFVVALERAYRRVLTAALRVRYGVLLLFFGLFAAVIVGLAPKVGFDLFPQDDSEALYIKVNLPPGTPIEHTEAVTTTLERQLPGFMGDDLLAVTARVGHQDAMAVDKTSGASENEAVVSAFLVPLGRSKTAAEWSALLSERLEIPDNATVTFEAKRLGPPVGRPVTIHVAANDDGARRMTAAHVQRWLDDIDGVVDIEIDERPGVRQVELAPDHEKLAMRGLDAGIVALTLKAAFHGLTVSEHRTLDQTTKFRVMFEPTARVDLEALLDTPMRTRTGELVSLRDVVSPVDVDSVSRIYHREGVRTATVTAAFAPDSGLDATAMAKRIEAELLPTARGENVSVYLGGEAVETAKTSQGMARAGGLAVFGIIVVIAVMLGSVLDAFLVVSVIPFGAAAVIAVFFAHGLPLSMFAVLGIIGLSGVVVNASIVMLDAVKQRLKTAEDTPAARRAAVIDAVVERLRPILVTTLTTLGGVLPTAYGLGGYDAVLSPMSLALGWGLVFATSITLFLVPALFIAAEDIRGLFRRRGDAVPVQS